MWYHVELGDEFSRYFRDDSVGNLKISDMVKIAMILMTFYLAIT